ncbi:MAG TPA: AAA family ATPase, partial [Acidocella sp.]|nr:AAA family ATPase [Acidocella sp.]
TMLGAARDAWEAQGYRVHGAALAGKAAEGLEESAGIASRTLASWERGWERGFDKLGPKDVFVIDEAGMVGSKQLSRFITEADLAGAKIVLVGDPEQLQPIGAGAAFRAVAERVGMVELEGVRRQGEGWQRAASVDFGRHRTEEGLAAYAERGAIRFEATGEAARNAIVRDVMADMDARPDGSRLVLAHRRVDVQDLNEAIRGVRLARGELAGEIVYQTTEGARAFAPGDRVLFRENNRELGVKNGMLGKVAQATEGHLSIRLDSSRGPGVGRAVEVSMANYAAVDHGYATTIHKSQGATVDRAYVLASGSMDRHLTYVSMTRHRDGVALYAGRDEFSDMGALSARLSRAQLKETTLDYDRAGYAQRRGLGRGGPESEIVVPQALRQAERPTRERPTQEHGLAPSHAADAVPEQAVASGRAGFRERYAAHKQQQALEAARDEQARGLVRQWGRLTGEYNKALPGLAADPSLGGAGARLLQFGDVLQAYPDAAQALRERGSAFGILGGSPLARVLAARQPARAITGLMNGVEKTMRDHLKQQAKREAAQQLERSASWGHGMSR